MAQKSMNKCKVCGKETHNVHYCSIKCRDISRNDKAYEIRKCKICGKEFTISKKHGKIYCSTKCSSSDPDVINRMVENVKKTKLERYGDAHYYNPEKMKKTIQEKYGVDYITQSSLFKETSKKTNQEKYGVDYPQQSEEIKKKTKSTVDKLYGGFTLQSDASREKVKNTMIEKYGVEHPLQSDEIRDKIKKTNQEKYGSDYGLQNQTVKGKGVETNLKKYGVKNVSQVLEIKEKATISNAKLFYEKLVNTSRLGDEIEIISTKDEYVSNVLSNDKSKFKCKRCGSEFLSAIEDGKIPRCYTCYPSQNTSKMEKEVFYYIKELLPNCMVLTNTKEVIKPLELDIYVPEYKIAIEFNGLYWHSDPRISDKNYHINKTKMCESLGIKLIHIFEDEWVSNKSYIKNLIKNELFIDMIDSCIIKEITNDEYESFPYLDDKFDISKYKLGAYIESELVAVMALGKKRGAYTILNYSYSVNSDKLHKSFISYIKDVFKPNIVDVYVDRSKRNKINTLYINMGFKLSNEGPVDYQYIINDFRVNKFHYRKSVLSDKLKLYDGSLSEWDNMLKNEYSRIWDCGVLKYTLESESDKLIE